MEFKNSALPGRGAGNGTPGILGRIVTALVSIAVLAVGVMFSVVFLAVALVVAAAFFGWLWWKVRRVAKQARSDPRFQEFTASMTRGAPPPTGDIIEGEVVRSEWKDRD